MPYAPVRAARLDTGGRLGSVVARSYSGGVSGIATRELGLALRRWAAGGVGVVRVLDKHGFGTVESGQLLVAGPGGAVAGGVYRGALDPVAVPLAGAATTAPAARDAHVAEEPAVAAGLACAGGARLLGHPLPAALAEALGEALAQGRPAALASSADGSAQLVLTGPELAAPAGTLGSSAVDDGVRGMACSLLRRGATVTERITEGGLDVLLDLWVPVPTVLVVGSGAIGEALLAQAALLGWGGHRVTDLDEARAALAGFTEADVLVLLDHAPRFDALLIDGVRRGQGFLGALGSRRTQTARRERLTRAGLSEAEIGTLHAPVGLDLAARTPAETAVSIVAEVIAVRGGRAGVALGGTEGRIGA
jgi:xanthine dehydrogenase accessory factor